MTIKVLLDSNFLFIPFQFQVDIFEGLMNLLNQQFEPILLSSTYQEVLRIAKEGSPKLRRQASLALKLAEKCQIIQIEPCPSESHDDVIVRVAKEWRCPVATNDRILRKKLRDINITVIFLRQRSYLEIDGQV